MPPAAFFFEVGFSEVKSPTDDPTPGGFGGGKAFDASFQEVSGLEVELEVEEIAEGGINNYKHRLPTRTNFRNLVLKRGLVIDTSKTMLYEWLNKTLFSETNLMNPIELRDVSISLFNEKKEPVMAWNVFAAYPIKWSLSNLNSQENALAIDTLELAYRHFKFDGYT